PPVHAVAPLPRGAGRGPEGRRRWDPRAPIGTRRLPGRSLDGPRRAAGTAPSVPRARDRPEVRLAGFPIRRPRTAHAPRPRIRVTGPVPRRAHPGSARLHGGPRRGAAVGRGLPDPVHDPLREGPG